MIISEKEQFLQTFFNFATTAPVYSGICCCGGEMVRHDSGYNCDHSPVDEWDNSVLHAIKAHDKFEDAAPQSIQDYADIAHLIGKIFYFGGFVAETHNEQLLKDLLIKTGNFYTTDDEVLSAVGSKELV